MEGELTRRTKGICRVAGTFHLWRRIRRAVGPIVVLVANLVKEMNLILI